MTRAFNPVGQGTPKNRHHVLRGLAPLREGWVNVEWRQETDDRICTSSGAFARHGITLVAPRLYFLSRKDRYWPVKRSDKVLLTFSMLLEFAVLCRPTDGCLLSACERCFTFR